MKKFTITLFLCVIVFLVTVTAFCVYLTTDHAKERVLQHISRAIPGRIFAETLDWSFFPFSIKADGIRLEDTEDKQCIEIRSAEAVFDLRAIVERTVKIDSIQLTQPRIQAVHDPTSGLNLARALGIETAGEKRRPDTPAALPVNIVIDKAELTQGSITYQDPANRITLPDIRMALSGFNLYNRSFAVRMESAGGTGRIDGKPVSITNMDLETKFNPESGAVFDAEFKSSVLSLKGRGQMDSFSGNPFLDLTLTARSDLDILALWTPAYQGAEGGIELSLTGSGPVNNPDAAFTVTMPKIRRDGKDLSDSISINARLSDRILTIEQAEAALLDTTLELNGNMDFSKAFPTGFLSRGAGINKVSYHLSFSQRNMDIKVLKPWIKGFNGRFSSNGTISGSGIPPDSIDGRCRIRMDLADVKKSGANRTLSEMKMSAEAEIENHILDITRFAVSAPDANAEGTAQIHLKQRTAEGTLTAESRDLFATLSPLGIDLLKGTMNSRIGFAGNIANPSIDMRIRAEDLAVQNLLLNRVDVQGSLSDSGRAEIRKMTLTRDKSSVHLKGRLDIFNREYRIRDAITGNLSVSGSDIQPAALLQQAGIAADPRFLPSLLHFDLDTEFICNKADFAISPNFQDNPIPFPAVTARMDLDQNRIFMQFDPMVSAETAFDFPQNTYTGTCRFSDTHIAPIAQYFGISGIKGTLNGTIRPTGKLPSTFSEKAKLALERAQGRITLDAAVGGTFKRPDFNAALQIEKAGFSVPGTDMAVSNLKGSVKATPDTIRIESLRAEVGEGTVLLFGRIGIHDRMIQTADLTLEGNRIRFEVPETGQAVFDADLALSVQSAGSHLSGRITLYEGEYGKDFTFDPVGTLTRRKRSTQQKDRLPAFDLPIFGETRLDVAIDAKTPLVVDNRTTLVLVEPDLTVTGFLSNPVITGRAKIPEGTVTYLDRTFEIETGIIRFTDPYAIDPEIELSASTEVRTWTIFMEISGKRENLRFRLYSEPEESHRDILSLLAAGKTAAELSREQGAAGSSTSLVTDKASEMLGRGIRDATPLDTFEMKYQNNGQNGGNVDVTMGKELTRRLEVKYSRRKEEQETVHTSEAGYKLLENLLLKTFNDSQGNFGGEVTFKLEFR